MLALGFRLCLGSPCGSGGQSVGDQLLGTLGVFFGYADFFREIRQWTITHQDGVDAVRFQQLLYRYHFHFVDAATRQAEDCHQPGFLRIVVRYHSLSILRRMEVWLETMVKA
jgi:hypothetical protein